MRFAQLYLFLYNSAQLAAWACVFAASVAASQSAPSLPAAAAAAYAASHRVVSVCQTVTLLETLHALTGLTRSGVAGNVMQWAGRTHCWFVLTQVPALQSSAATLALLLAWSLSDVVRYSWAALTALGICPRSLTWLRYTVFIPLYPVGFLSELTLLRGGLPAAAAGTVVQVLRLPNALNFSFDYSYFLLFVLLLYPGAWLQLYAHVFRQRAKLFAAGAKKQR
jgi:very-long-chain (3R)-3-hydroxyacyl-CoA dehydratase